MFAPNAAGSGRKCDITSGLIHCRMYQDKLASLKRQLQQLQEGNRSDFFFFINIISSYDWRSQEFSKREWLVQCILWDLCEIEDWFSSEIFEGHSQILSY